MVKETRETNRKMNLIVIKLFCKLGNAQKFIVTTNNAYEPFNKNEKIYCGIKIDRNYYYDKRTFLQILIYTTMWYIVMQEAKTFHNI